MRLRLHHYPFVCFADISPIRGILIRPYELRIAIGFVQNPTVHGAPSRRPLRVAFTVMGLCEIEACRGGRENPSLRVQCVVSRIVGTALAAVRFRAQNPSVTATPCHLPLQVAKERTQPHKNTVGCVAVFISASGYTANRARYRYVRRIARPKTLQSRRKRFLRYA